MLWCYNKTLRGRLFIALFVALKGFSSIMLKKRLARLRGRIYSQGLDGLIVSLPAHRRYLSGFTPDDGQWGETSGWLFITAYHAVLLTDFRYELSAREQAPLFEVIMHRQGMANALKPLLEEIRLERLGIEADAMLVAHRERLARELGVDLELVSTMGLVSALRVCKDPYELEAIQASLGIMEQVLGNVMESDIVGKTERELALAITRAVEDAGADGAAFDPIVASGPNGAEPHAEPGQRVISAGEPVIFDVGAKSQGYCSDISRTVVAGGLEEADERFREVYATVRKAQLKAIAEIKPGMTCAEADATSRKVIEDAGYGERFGHSLGHGVGLATHEAPSVGPNSMEILKPGMVFTVEPGIYLPGWGGVRLEEMVALTEDGCQLLNTLDGFYDLP
jgi:Xaa-Pro aminopeptidase